MMKNVGAERFERAMEKQIIFEDEHIRVIFLQGSTDTLVVSFGDLITRANGLNINAEKSLVQYGYSALGIMPKRKSWFPALSMQHMWTDLHPHIQGFQHIVMYGGSMGGYAAIKYAKLFQATRVVALVPQYSINPEDVVDRRYSEFFDLEANADMQIQANDIRQDAEYLLIYDPYYADDREHYLKIQPLIPQLQTLNLPFTGHDALAVLANSALLNDFICHEIDLPYFYQQIRRVKKNNKFYYRHIVAQSIKKHRHSLGKILKNNDLSLESQFFDNVLKQTITRELLTNKQVNEQDLLKLGIQVKLPNESRSQLIDCFGHVLVFNLISQKIESYPTEVILRNHKYLVAIQAKASGLAKIRLNDDCYLLAMNDRKIVKLFMIDDELSLDMTPILIKKYPDYFVLAYKDFILHSDAQGQIEFLQGQQEDLYQFKLA